MPPAECISVFLCETTMSQCSALNSHICSASFELDPIMDLSADATTGLEHGSIASSADSRGLFVCLNRDLRL